MWSAHSGLLQGDQAAGPSATRRTQTTRRRVQRAQGRAPSPGMVKEQGARTRRAQRQLTGDWWLVTWAEGKERATAHAHAHTQRTSSGAPEEDLRWCREMEGGLARLTTETANGCTHVSRMDKTQFAVRDLQSFWNSRRLFQTLHAQLSDMSPMLHGAGCPAGCRGSGAVYAEQRGSRVAESMLDLSALLAGNSPLQTTWCGLVWRERMYKEVEGIRSASRMRLSSCFYRQISVSARDANTLLLANSVVGILASIVQDSHWPLLSSA
ncbi:hypothetical protein BDV95DRAFT_598389 [Massariosphaeria phaeospora]|uniref:Uncharacterized protein n=1 Tax=Massariosphaeria phaeospora TaxID=100035 RepID=A0A7C8I0E4_9PLEO|nr:hypothetical protein BDV95DRAFT_598389 [Massariosphaeria phaeospora]